MFFGFVLGPDRVRRTCQSRDGKVMLMGGNSNTEEVKPKQPIAYSLQPNSLHNKILRNRFVFIHLVNYVGKKICDRKHLYFVGMTAQGNSIGNNNLGDT